MGSLTRLLASRLARVWQQRRKLGSEQTKNVSSAYRNSSRLSFSPSDHDHDPLFYLSCSCNGSAASPIYLAFFYPPDTVPAHHTGIVNDGSSTMRKLLNCGLRKSDVSSHLLPSVAIVESVFEVDSDNVSISFNLGFTHLVHSDQAQRQGYLASQRVPVRGPISHRYQQARLLQGGGGDYRRRMPSRLRGPIRFLDHAPIRQQWRKL